STLAAEVRQQIAGSAIQPGELIALRQVGAAAPGGGEHVRTQVLGVATGAAAQEEPVHRVQMGLEEVLEPVPFPQPVRTGSSRHGGDLIGVAHRQLLRQDRTQGSWSLCRAGPDRCTPGSPALWLAAGERPSSRESGRSRLADGSELVERYLRVGEPGRVDLPADVLAQLVG